jgi:hypothetical protein
MGMSKFIVVVGLVSSLIIIAGKWGILDWYQVKRKMWMPDAGCFFCIGFWLSLIMWTVDGNQFFSIPAALVTAPFINYIVSHARGKAE